MGGGICYSRGGIYKEDDYGMIDMLLNLQAVLFYTIFSVDTLCRLYTSIQYCVQYVTLLHSERPKLYTILAFLSAKELTCVQFLL